MRMMFAARAMNNMAGGVERMIIAIMNEMARRGHEVALFSWDHAAAEAFYPIDPRVQWFKLDLGNPAQRAGLGLRLQRAPNVRRIVKAFAPDVIVGFQGGAFRPMAFYTLGHGIPVVAAERTAPSLYEHAGTERKRQIELFSFRFAKTITVQFDRYRLGYPAFLQDKIVETPNPVAVASRHANPGAPGANGRYTLLSVGRLSYQKNYDVLLEAFARLADRFSLWDLRIVGEGEDRAKLEAMIAATPALKGRVALPGATQDVATQYAAAQLFCLPSRWEGFPNALAEALAHGLPSVGFENCSGVPDLIAAGQSGVLAPGMNDANALAEALAKLMDDPQGRTAQGQYAVESMQRYSPDRCFDQWESVLLKAGE
ncbi:glycosyltransferase family 4 protein [Devosia sp. XJ19-1]|uniref:Glycosyltransferase family 4 protein n=1 Tax=Devosia ureilytica TaxID=2952754 RepID=A0A9Q4AKT2_9HYPH|nr:glycosyltransferase family 4 protein [Devosia ureilytica]MCP8882613.1 glycosyltransferase family 4 protein [Devosia ureilytica]MCP8885500.1 glycosyltransferase family 4 protein [Devosia ureilytica]